MCDGRHTDDQGQILQFASFTLVLDSSQALIDEATRLVRGLFVNDKLRVISMRSSRELVTVNYVPDS